jgi:hypothetical protein
MQDLTFLLDWQKVVLFIVGCSVLYVWTFRYKNVDRDFQNFGLSGQTKAMVGTSKIAAGTLLITSIWFPDLTIGSTAMMAFFLAAAQFFHFRYHSALLNRIPSFVLLSACLMVLFSKLNQSAL